jgi:hypothetical protein
VRDALRGACGWAVAHRMVYKPDIYTHLGIYAAGGILRTRTSTRPTLNRRTESTRLCQHFSSR